MHEVRVEGSDKRKRESRRDIVSIEYVNEIIREKSSEIREGPRSFDSLTKPQRLSIDYRREFRWRGILANGTPGIHTTAVVEYFDSLHTRTVAHTTARNQCAWAAAPA